MTQMYKPNFMTLGEKQIYTATIAPHLEKVLQMIEETNDNVDPKIQEKKIVEVSSDIEDFNENLDMDEDRRLGDSLIEHMRESPELIVGDNEPYQINVVDHTIPVHGASRGLQRVLVEIRQNLIETRAGQREWASRLADALESVLPEFAVRI